MYTLEGYEHDLHLKSLSWKLFASTLQMMFMMIIESDILFEVIYKLKYEGRLTKLFS
jgi:hypothetical protein